MREVDEPPGGGRAAMPGGRCRSGRMESRNGQGRGAGIDRESSEGWRGARKNNALVATRRSRERWSVSGIRGFERRGSRLWVGRLVEIGLGGQQRAQTRAMPYAASGASATCALSRLLEIWTRLLGLSCPVWSQKAQPPLQQKGLRIGNPGDAAVGLGFVSCQPQPWVQCSPLHASPVPARGSTNAATGAKLARRGDANHTLGADRGEAGMEWAVGVLGALDKYATRCSKVVWFVWLGWHRWLRCATD